MVVAVAKALETGRERDHLRLDRQHVGVGGGVRRPRPVSRSSSCCRAAGSRPASCSRRLVAGARVVAVDGNFDAALRIVRAMAEQDDHPVTLVNSVNPHRLEGQKTAAFEICDDLGRAPDVLAIPVGNAGNISAYWAGFRDYATAGIVATSAADARLPGGGRRAARAGPADRRAGDDRNRDPDRQPGVVGVGRGRSRRERRRDRIRDGRRDPRRVPLAGRGRGHLLRAVVGDEPRRSRLRGRARWPGARCGRSSACSRGAGSRTPRRRNRSLRRTP